MENITEQRPQPDISLFRDVFNASPIGIAVENLEGQPLFINPAFCSFLGFSEEELRDKHCVDFSPPEDAEKDWALFQQLQAGSIQNYQLDKRYFRRDGSVVWGRLSISLLNGDPSPLVLAMVEDITEKKNAEETRFRHAAVIESSDDAIASGTLDGKIVSWNTGAQKMYGYTEAEAVGRPIAMLVPPELPDEENRILETLKAGRRIEHFETVRVSKTGKRINVSLSISPIKDSSGRIVGISGIARDITERKLAEEALRASEQRLRLAQHAAGIGTFERDVRTGRITWSEGLESLYGLPPGSVHGKTTAFFNDLIHPADRARTAHLIQQALQTGQPTEGEWRAIWPDGSVHWIVSRWRVLMNDSGEPSRVVGLNMDVTARKLTEEALRESEQRLKLANQVGRMYAYDWDVKSNFVVRSSEHVKILGLKDPLHLPQQQFVERIHPDDRQKFIAAIAGLSPENPTSEVTYRAVASDGSLVWLKSNGRGFFDTDGKLLRVIGMVADVTDIKRAEEARSEMTRKLIEAQEQERARIGRELHDDISQRLAVLNVELEQLQDNPSEVAVGIQELRKQVSDISSDVQALSHDLHSSKLEFLGVVAGMKSWCKELAQRHGMQIDFRQDVQRILPPEIGLSLFRVLQEALHNAAKHSGVKRIEVQMREDCGEIHLIVSDLGRGFDAEAAMHGKGLGLTSMRERVRLLNGTITIDSKPLRGTTIHVKVPLTSQSDSARAAG